MKIAHKPNKSHKSLKIYLIFMGLIGILYIVLYSLDTKVDTVLLCKTLYDIKCNEVIAVKDKFCKWDGGGARSSFDCYKTFTKAIYPDGTEIPFSSCTQIVFNSYNCYGLKAEDGMWNLKVLKYGQ